MEKTILYIGVFDFEKEPAAVQRVLPNVTMFEQLGYKVIFLSATENAERIGINNSFTAKGYKSYGFPTPISFINRLKFKVSRLLVKDIIEKEKTIVAVMMYNYPAVAMYRISRLCKKYGVAAIGDVTEWYAANGNLLEKAVLAIDITLRMKYTHRLMDGLILTSTYLYNYYNDFNKPRLLLPTLVDMADPKWEACKCERSKFSDNSPITITTIGVLNERAKGQGKDEVFTIIRYLNEIKKDTSIPNVVLRVIGTTYEQYIRLYGTACDLSSVEFMGRLSHSETLRNISSSDFFIFIRARNRINMAGSPTKFSEALACGVPVITTNTSDLPDYLSEGNNGFFISDMPAEAIQKLKQVLCISKAEIADMRSYCSKNIPLDYHFFIPQTEIFFKKVTDPKRGGRYSV